MEWDSYFHSLCRVVADKSPCLSRKIGALLVRDNRVIASGYNGPAEGAPHCGHVRLIKDKILQEHLRPIMKDLYNKKATIQNTCPRKLLGFSSGEGLHLCLAEHAERNCIASAARAGISTKDASLYMNCILPCKNCATLLINAGIKEIIVEELISYDMYSNYVLDHSNITLRTFNYETQTLDDRSY